MNSISILMLCYNQKGYLPAAINSVLSQFEVDTELIIIDPGSTDGSRDYLLRRAAMDSRIRLVLEPDKGPADGLEKAWKMATKDIVGCLNSDDIYLPKTFSRVLKAWERDPEAAILTASGFISEAGKVRMQLIDKYTPIRYALGVGLVLHQSTFYARKKLNERGIHFRSDNRTCWDAEILMDTYEAGLKISRVKDLWGIFRIHDESITGSKRIRDIYIQEHVALAERALGFRVNKFLFQVFQFYSRIWAVNRRIRARVGGWKLRKRMLTSYVSVEAEMGIHQIEA
jgi:glycosyltransferase involved in cell wall biosynthesis